MRNSQPDVTRLRTFNRYILIHVGHLLLGAMCMLLFFFLSVGPAHAETVSAILCPNITSNLYQGLSDVETNGQVSELQTFLTSTGDYTYGEVTGYFGPVTEQSVQRFQCAHGVVCSGSPQTTGYGLVGPQTRAAIAGVCSAGTGALLNRDTAPSLSSASVQTTDTQTAVGAGTTNVTVGRMENLTSVDGIDSTFPTIVKNGERQTILSFGKNKWIKYKGSLKNPFASVIWQKYGYTVLGRPKPPSTGAYDRYWLMNVYQPDLERGQVLGFIHVENKHDNRNSTYFRGRLALAWSNNYGDSWDYLGDIMVPRFPDETVNPGGTPYIIKDGYFYVYYLEAVSNGGGQYVRGTAVVRAKVDDVIEAAKEGKTVPWKKYNNGQWNSPGIGGAATLLLPIAAGHNHTDAAYSTYTKRWYLLLANSANEDERSTLKLYESVDGVTWNLKKNIASRKLQSGQTHYNGYHYPVILNKNGRDNGVVGDAMYVYAALFNANRATAGYPIVRWKIDFDIAGAPSPEPEPEPEPEPQPEPDPQPAEVYVRSQDFGSTQGENRWWYKMAKNGATPNLTWNAREQRWDNGGDYPYITKGGMHPGDDSWSADLRWTAPHDGTIEVTGKVADINDSCGDGVGVAIYQQPHDSLARNYLRWDAVVRNGNTSGVRHNVTLSVRTGDFIHFLVDPQGTGDTPDHRCDGTTWDPVITYQ